jgi:SNF2 family DNA or RNA helicase
MKVSAQEPFQIIYSLYEHEYLGYLFDSFVVKLDTQGRLTLQHQNISSKNAPEFAAGLDEKDFELIDLMDSMQQEAVVNRFSKNGIKPKDFFLKTYDPEKGSKLLQTEINNQLEVRRGHILDLLPGKLLFEMGSDGEPAWKPLTVQPKKATILFHFRRNEHNTHYFPTIKYGGQKVDFQYKGAYLLCNDPAWLVVEGRVFSFEKNIDGKKLAPFLNKKFIAVPEKIEDTYYRKFIAPLVASFDVYAKGFEIKTEKYEPQPHLCFYPLAEQQTLPMFKEDSDTLTLTETKIGFVLSFNYGPFRIRADRYDPVFVNLEKTPDSYVFHRITRSISTENRYIDMLKEAGLELRNARKSMPVGQAFQWLEDEQENLIRQGFSIDQKGSSGKKYFMGKATISVEIKENIDWFDINAVIKFGDFEIPFKELRTMLLTGSNEIKLPNGEIAVIPDGWVKDYAELFSFVHENGETRAKLDKHHLALVQDMEKGELSKVTMDRKLDQLKDFDTIEEFPQPENFNGTLRAYQKAGYDWLQFLNRYRFGGCLADDMGLGKTVQTLALLQAEQEKGVKNASLLVMPTSLVYNWQLEAKKFTPNLKVHVYVGTNRVKDVSQFEGYDLVVTSYGIVRRDIEELQGYYFNYVILDESQAIKNPGSNISKAVKKMNSKHRLILTGTPLENSTMDLWSQMSFINPGLLGQKSFFKKNYQLPIEKQGSEEHTHKLFTLIKPFILRRHKSQVAKELPEKFEHIHYCSMSDAQQEEYEEVKNQYRNKILNHIDQHGVNKSQMVLLQGLTQLRQIANHPKMVNPDYRGGSGKLEEMLRMMDNALAEGHKMLIFSQFVKHLTILRQDLDREGINYCYLDGSTKNRQEQVECFQNDNSVRVFLISLKAGGLGLNLTEADYVFLLDPWWNPAVELQAIDRAHRIGQDKTVFTYKFITKNTVEEKILALQSRKLKLASDLITTDQGFVKNLTKDDIQELLN